jgi:hypothetical protein
VEPHGVEHVTTDLLTTDPPIVEAQYFSKALAKNGTAQVILDFVEHVGELPERWFEIRSCLTYLGGSTRVAK